MAAHRNPYHLTALLAAGVTCAATVLAAQAARADGCGSSCGYENPGTAPGIGAGANSPGSPNSGGATGGQNAGYQNGGAPAPPCNPGPGPANCTSWGGAPAAAGPTPAQLAQGAYNSLPLPKPDVHTAPPKGQDGLVGLPEWVWVPAAEWKPVSVTARAGAVWATVTAAPSEIIIQPGTGLTAVQCPGPGTAYDPAQPAGGQQPSCSVTYQQSSAAQPGGSYPVTVQIVWSVTWAGSGGAGGALPDLPTDAQLALRVAEGQSVN